LDYGDTWGANPDSALLKISYLRGNLQPVAKLAVSSPSGPVPMVTSTFLPADGKAAGVDPGLALMRQSDCFNFHAMETPLIGPSFVDIADKYCKQAGADDLLNKKGRLGGSGVWGQVPMLAHPQHTEDEVSMMLRWMLALEKGKTGPTVTRGLEGRPTAPRDNKPGTLLLEAVFTDAGAGAAGALSGKAEVKLRNRRIGAESGEFTNATIIGKAIGATNHGTTIKFTQLNLATTSAVKVNASAGGAAKGSQVEVRLDAPDGPRSPSAHASQWGPFRIPTLPLNL
jgi:cytochrome c